MRAMPKVLLSDQTVEFALPSCSLGNPCALRLDCIPVGVETARGDCGCLRPWIGPRPLRRDRESAGTARYRQYRTTSKNAAGSFAWRIFNGSGSFWGKLRASDRKSTRLNSSHLGI